MKDAAILTILCLSPAVILWWPVISSAATVCGFITEAAVTNISQEVITTHKARKEKA